MTKKELDKAVVETTKQLEDWFVANPKRRVCRAELWYGKQYKIKRKDVLGQLAKIAAATKTQPIKKST